MLLLQLNMTWVGSYKKKVYILHTWHGMRIFLCDKYLSIRQMVIMVLFYHVSLFYFKPKMLNLNMVHRFHFQKGKYEIPNWLSHESIEILAQMLQVSLAILLVWNCMSSGTITD